MVPAVTRSRGQGGPKGWSVTSTAASSSDPFPSDGWLSTYCSVSLVLVLDNGSHHLITRYAY